MPLEKVFVAPDAIFTERELATRHRRWHSFNVIFSLTYLGIILDIVTTAMGFGVDGAKYEQNPIGASLIHAVGWGGLFLLMTALSALLYVSFRAVYWRMSTAWSAGLNVALALVAVVRWLTVTGAVIYLAQVGS